MADEPIVWVVEERWTDRRRTSGWQRWHPVQASLDHDAMLTVKRKLQGQTRVAHMVTQHQHRLVPYVRAERT